MLIKSKQKGLFLILYLMLFVALLIICGFVIDFGMMYNAQIELKKATDQAALAGAIQLTKNEEVDSAVNTLLAQNKVLGETLQEATLVLGQFDDANQSFYETTEQPTAVQLNTTFTSQTLFGKIINVPTYTLHASSIASIEDKRPVELILIADISTYMSLASQLQGIDLGLPMEKVLNNLNHIYNQLHDKQLLLPNQYGALTWNQVIAPAPIESILKQLELTTVPYPFSEFTWNNYVEYVQHLNHANQSYKDHYGFLTLINFWQEKAFMATQTPILNEIAEEPLQSLKNSLMPLSEGLKAETDQMGLSLISPEEFVIPLTSEFDTILQQMNHYQAGHYGLPNGHIGSAVAATLGAFSSKNHNKVIFILASGQSGWGENLENTLATLKNKKIKTFRLVIGDNTEENLNHQITHQTGGKVWQVPLENQDYSDFIQEFLKTIQMGSPRLVQ